MVCEVGLADDALARIRFGEVDVGVVNASLRRKKHALDAADAVFGNDMVE